jgi:hypothetical protein
MRGTVRTTYSTVGSKPQGSGGKGAGGLRRAPEALVQLGGAPEISLMQDCGSVNTQINITSWNKNAAAGFDKQAGRGRRLAPCSVSSG